MPLTDRERCFLNSVAVDGARIISLLERLRHQALELNLPLPVPAKLPVLEMISHAARLKHASTDAKPDHP